MIFVLVVAVALIADQGSKLWARHSLPVRPAACAIPDDIVAGKCGGAPVPVIDGFWEWRLSFNQGAAFSMLESQGGTRVLLSLIASLAVIGIGWMVKKAREDQRTLVVGLGLIAGGALGNLCDRVYFGVVTDFVRWHYHQHSWPIFNVADVVLFIGVGVMMIATLREPKAAPAARTA
jgi:signal peptidase II